MPCNKGVPVHTSQHDLQAPSVCLETDDSNVQGIPDWLTHMAQGQPVSPCRTRWGL